MSADRTLSFRFDHPAADVQALLHDPDFLAERSRAMGELDVQVTTKRDGDRVAIVNARNVQRELPGFAKKLFNPVNHITQTSTWQLAGDVATGSSVIEVRGAPVTITTKFELRPAGGGCEYRVTFDVKVRVPLIGGKLEAYTLEQTLAGAQKELEYTAERLRSAA